MKVGQSSIVRWVYKLVGTKTRSAERHARSTIRTLDEAQLRKVSGGTASTELPHKGW